MKRYIALFTASFLTACVIWYGLRMAVLSENIFFIPSTVKIEFYSGNECWKVRYVRTVESAPVRAEDISSAQLEAARGFAVKKYGADSMRLFYGRALAAIVAQERGGMPVVRAADEIFLSLYCAARYDERTLAAAFFNRKTIMGHIAGMGLCAQSGYGKTIAQLDVPSFTALFRYYCAPSQRNIAPDIFLRLQTRAQKNIISADDPFCAAPADYGESVLRSMNLYPPVGSLRVYTTIDPVRQKRFESAAPRFIAGLEGQPAYKKTMLSRLPAIESAALAADLHSGAIRAMTGGTVYGGTNRLNRCLSRRQISSTFKPFLYAQAFEDGICAPDTMFEDKPVKVKNNDGSVWEPKNFYPYYIGSVRAKDALSLSINTVSVQLIDQVGIGRMTLAARRIFSMPGNGIAWRIGEEPSLALGSIDCSPLELAKGYLMLGSGGSEVLPYIIEKIEDAEGKTLFIKREEKQRRIFSTETCRTVVSVLQNVIRTGTASKFIQRKFPFDAAGKSGSSPADSWFVGFNPETLIVAWAGYDLPVMSREGKIPEFTIIPFWYYLMSEENPGKKTF